MDIQKRNRVVARALGLTLDQVGAYLHSVVTQPDGSWLAGFSNEVERAPEVSSKIPAWKIALISESDVRADTGDECLIS